MSKVKIPESQCNHDMIFVALIMARWKDGPVECAYCNKFIDVEPHLSGLERRYEAHIRETDNDKETKL